jgi:hypothetical protein
MVTAPSPPPSTTPVTSYQKTDGDIDDKYPPSRHAELDDEVLFRQYKTKANPTTTRAIAAIVKRYYAAAAAGDTSTVCSLLYSSFADQLAGEESHAGQGGEACANAVAPLLEQQRQQFIEDEPSTMVVLGARLKGESAIALLGFQKAPESSILVQREGKTWKVGVLSGTELP